MHSDRWNLISRASGAVVAALGATVLLAWALDLKTLQSILPDLPTMKANTACAFILSGIALCLLSFEQLPRITARLHSTGYPSSIWGGHACALGVVVIASLTLAEYALGWNARIDEILFVDAETRAGSGIPGRMSIATATNFLLIAVALLSIDLETPRGARPAQWLALLVGVISYLALIAYLFDAHSLQRIAPYSTMAVHTATAFFVVSGGVLAARANRGLMSVVTDHTAGGMMARRLVPAAILIPPCLGWLRTLGQDVGWYDESFGRALLVLSVAMVFVALIWRNARLLSRIDARRETGERSAREGQRLLQTVIDNSPAVVYAKDLQGRYLLANQRFNELLHIGVEGVVGRTDFDLFPEKDAAAFRDMDVRTALAGTPVTEEEVLPQQDGPQYFLSVKCALRDASGEIYGIVGISTDITARKHAEAERLSLLERERQIREEAEALYAVARALASEREVEQVVQYVIDAATRLTGAQFGAFFQNLTNDKGESYLLYTISGAPRAAFDKFGPPRNTPLFEQTFRGAGPVRIDDVLIDARYGRSAPHHGMPPGHLPVRSYLAVPIISRTGAVLGGLFFGHGDASVFDERAERIAVGVAAQAAVAVDNARLNQSIQESAARLTSQLGQLRLLDEITRAIDQRHDLGSIFQVVIRSLEDQLPVDFGCFCLYDASVAALTVSHVGVKGDPMPLELRFAERMSIPIDENGLARCVSGHLVHEPDIGESRFAFPQRLVKSGLHSVVFVPLVLDRQVFGVLVVARRAANTFTSVECEFLRQLCDHVALAAHQAQLYGSLQQAYDELRQSQQAVLQQERLRSLGQMASGIAHDINNAISPIALYTDALLDHEPGLTVRGREYLQTIQRAIGDVAGTISRMREFYRPREAQLELQVINLNDTVSQVIELTRPRWSDMPQERGVVIRLKTEFAPELPPIMGAETEIRDGLTNLIFNAVDSMPEGGTLTLRTRMDKEPSSDITGIEKVRLAIVEVVDTGAGMDEETRKHCLEPFFTTKGERGTGLGLAMVYGMAQRHNANLEIDSAKGMGTTARVVFQALSTHTKTTPHRRPVKVERRLRILLIDDDPVLLKSLTNVLMSDGHSVVPADGGQSGIEKFRAAGGPLRFDIVITDLGMPYVDGRRVAAELHKLSAATPVIMLTGWGQRLKEDEGIPAHVARVLSKPPKIYELRSALNELTGVGPSPN